MGKSITDPTQCEHKQCPSKREFTARIGGKCTACPEYQIANKRKFGCESPKCQNPRERLNELGECIACASYEIRAQDNDKSCTRNTCKIDEYLKPDASCKRCIGETYTAAYDDTKCEKSRCGVDSYITIAQDQIICNYCPPFMEADPLKGFKGCRYK